MSIRAKHRRLANHSGDLDIPFHKRMAKLKPVTRLQALYRYIKKHGYRVVHISRKLSNKFWLRNITLHRTIVTGAKWFKKTAIEKCITLMHEIVHMRQRIRMGRAKFLARYALAEWRWALEASAYRSNRLTWGPTWVLNPRWFRKFYRFGRLKKRDVLRETNAVFALMGRS